jgi:soluble lytic murein transglycosylase-like protein
MKLLNRAPFLRACLLATLVYHTVPTESLGPVALRLSIPAPRFTMNEIIRAVSLKHHVKTAFVKSIIAAESGFSPSVVSPKGAVGLMQLMPATAREFGADPAVPEQNVEAGAHYLSWLMQRYANRRDQLPRAIAAYNAGPGAVEHYHGVPPYRETRNYVSRVLRFFKKYQNDELHGLG